MSVQQLNRSGGSKIKNKMVTVIRFILKTVINLTEGFSYRLAVYGGEFLGHGGRTGLHGVGGQGPQPYIGNPAEAEEQRL